MIRKGLIMEQKDYRLLDIDENKRPYFSYLFRLFEESLKKKFRDFNHKYGIIINKNEQDDNAKYTVNILKNDEPNLSYTLEWYFDSSRNMKYINEICYEIRKFFFFKKAPSLVGSLYRRNMVFNDSDIMHFLRQMIHYRNSFSHAVHETVYLEIKDNIIKFIEIVYNNMPEDKKLNNINDYFAIVGGKKFLSYQGIVFCLSLLLTNEQIALFGNKIAGKNYDRMDDLLYYAKGSSRKEYNLGDNNYSNIVEFLLQYKKMNNSAIPFLRICRDFLKPDFDDYKLSNEMITLYNKEYRIKKQTNNTLPKKAYKFNSHHLYKIEQNKLIFTLSENDLIILVQLKIDDEALYKQTLTEISKYVNEYYQNLNELRKRLGINSWHCKGNIPPDIVETVNNLHYKDIEFLKINNIQNKDSFEKLKKEGLKEKVISGDDLINAKNSIEEFFKALPSELNKSVKTVVKLINDFFVTRLYDENQVGKQWKDKYKKLSHSFDKRTYLELIKIFTLLPFADKENYRKSVAHIQNVLKNESKNTLRSFSPYDKRNRDDKNTDIKYEYNIGTVLELLIESNNYSQFYNKFIPQAKEKMLQKEYIYKQTKFADYIIHAIQTSSPNKIFQGNTKPLSPLINSNIKLEKYKKIENLNMYIQEGLFNPDKACNKYLFDYKKIALVYKIFEELPLVKKNTVTNVVIRKLESDTFLKEENQQFVANLLQQQVQNNYQIEGLTLEHITREIYIEVTRHQIFNRINEIVKERRIKATLSDYKNWITNFNNLTKSVVSEIIKAESDCVKAGSLTTQNNYLYLEFEEICNKTDIVKILTGDEKNKKMLIHIRNYFFHQMIYINPASTNREQNNKKFYNFIFDIISKKEIFVSFKEFFNKIKVLNVIN